MESDEELTARHARVKAMIGKAHASIGRMKPSAQRTRKAQFCGSLGFTLSVIEAEMKARGLIPDPRKISR